MAAQHAEGTHAQLQGGIYAAARTACHCNKAAASQGMSHHTHALLLWFIEKVNLNLPHRGYGM